MPENLYTPNCLRTYSGKYINLLDPLPESITAQDIAIGLSRQARFAGHTTAFYSVAQHSVWCLEKYEALPLHGPFPDMQLKILLHDAHEYLLGDIPTPLKALMPEYGCIAEKLQEAIHKRFEITVTPQEATLIKEIDKLALEWEWENKVLAPEGVAYRMRDVMIDYKFNLSLYTKQPIAHYDA